MDQRAADLPVGLGVDAKDHRLMRSGVVRALQTSSMEAVMVVEAVVRRSLLPNRPGFGKPAYLAAPQAKAGTEQPVAWGASSPAGEGPFMASH
jgi:hypothetical protein